MPYTRSSHGLPSVLKQLGEMTAIRDTYLVEQSLLRTLGPMLGVTETWLYRLDSAGNLVRTLRHSRRVESAPEGGQRVEEQLEEEMAHPMDIPAEVEAIIDSVRILNKACTEKLDEHQHLICHPIYGGKAICGFFLLRRERELSGTEVATVQGVLEVFNNFYGLLDTSQRDRLTGLFNRYSLELNLDRLWNLLHARRQIPRGDKDLRREQVAPQVYWLGVMDVDHFKTINDTHGHIIGDEVLIIIARLLESAFRSSDLLYRYGGEEFIAIIAASDAEAASQTFERARRKIEAFKFPRVGRITISGGFSRADPSVLPQEVINRADRALYESKNLGRNRFCEYEGLVAAGSIKAVNAGSVDLF